MNLLLLLSAILSALTGVGSGARAPGEATAMVAARATLAPTADRVVAAATVRPVQLLATRRDIAALPRASAVPVPATEPRYASRRRE